MKSHQMSFLDRYYDFAEKCDDDLDIMARALKMSGCIKKPSLIKNNLENMSVDSCYCKEYDKIIASMNGAVIDSARWHVQQERSKEARCQLTLF